ncbi:MAG: carboxyl transferase, partial [Deltaproteobacteria bacterium]|nr:carboxyl transferase [Deltaproteobacteria bacterium]
REAELRKVGARVTNAMNALSQVTVPKISVVIRKSYGQAAANMCGPGTGPDFILAWPTGEAGFVDPETASDIAFGSLPEDQRRELMEQMIADTNLYPLAGLFHIHDIIDPRETRDHLLRMLDIIANSRSRGIGNHRLANWPTAL